MAPATANGGSDMSVTTANTDQIHPGKVYNKAVVIISATGTNEVVLVPSAENVDGLRIDSITADYDDVAEIKLRFLLKTPEGVLVRQGVVKVSALAGSDVDKPALELLESWRGAKRSIKGGWELLVQPLTAVPANKSLHITLDGGAF